MVDNGTRGHAGVAEQVKILDYSPAARLDYYSTYYFVTNLKINYMCGRVKSIKAGPSSLFNFRTTAGISNGKWGLFNGQQYNARSERLDERWKNLARGVLYVDSFWESNKEFKRIDCKDFAIAVIYNPKNEFAILTCPANELVKPVHDRMPLIITDSSASAWLYNGTIVQLTNVQEFVPYAA